MKIKINYNRKLTLMAMVAMGVYIYISYTFQRSKLCPTMTEYKT